MLISRRPTKVYVLYFDLILSLTFLLLQHPIPLFIFFYNKLTIIYFGIIIHNNFLIYVNFKSYLAILLIPVFDIDFDFDLIKRKAQSISFIIFSQQILLKQNKCVVINLLIQISQLKFQGDIQTVCDMQKFNKQLQKYEKLAFLKQIIHNAQIIDFRNGRYQGAISRTQLKQGIGVFLDDNLTFMISKWKQNLPNQETLIITRTGSYIYGLWNQTLQNFQGVTAIGNSNYFTLVNFINSNIKGKTIIVSYEQKSVLVLEKLQILQNGINQKNIQIVEFTRFQEDFNLKSIVQIYSNKYSLLIQSYQHSIEEFMKYYVSRKYNDQAKILLRSQKKQVKFKQDNSIQINQENFLCFHQKQKNSKRKNEFYFGYSTGIGINFKISQSKFKLISIGIHSQQKIKQFGLKVHDQRCVQQGDFLGKITFTYILQIQRPVDKLLSIYQKIHKRSLSFQNKYLQIKLLFFNFFDNYLLNKCGYIFVDCLRLRQEQKNKQNSNQFKHQTYAVVKKQLLQRKQNSFKSKSQSKTPRKLKQSQRNINKEIQDKKQSKNNQKQNPLLKTIKEKKEQLKNKIQKVKYQIQYTTPQKPKSVFRKKQLMSPISAKLDLSKSKVNIKRSKSKSPINKKKIKKSADKQNKSNSKNKNKYKDVTKKIKDKQLDNNPLYHKNKKGQKIFNQLNVQKLLQKRSADKSLNKYNGRQKKYSDEELDAMIKDYKFRKQRYYHINNIRMQNQQQKYQQQKMIQDKIRAQLVKMTPQQYTIYHRNKQMKTKQLQSLILHQNQMLQKKIQLRQIQQNYQQQKRKQCGCRKNPHLQREIYVYPLEENLAQKRMRILSDFKNLNRDYLNQENNRLEQLRLNYGKTLSEYMSPDCSRAHYNHALQTTFANNLLNASSIKNIQDEYIEEKLLKYQLQRSRMIQRQLLKEEQENLIRHKMSKHIIEQGIHQNSGKTRYQYYFQ